MLPLQLLEFVAQPYTAKRVNENTINIPGLWPFIESKQSC